MRSEYNDVGHTVSVQKTRKGKNYTTHTTMPGENCIFPMKTRDSIRRDETQATQAITYKFSKQAIFFADVHRVVSQGYLYLQRRLMEGGAK